MNPIRTVDTSAFSRDLSPRGRGKYSSSSVTRYRLHPSTGIEVIEHLLDQVIGRRCARRYTDHVRRIQPFGPDRIRGIDPVGGGLHAGGPDQGVGIRRVIGTHHQDQITFAAHLEYCLLAVGGGVAKIALA